MSNRSARTKTNPIKDFKAAERRRNIITYSAIAAVVALIIGAAVWSTAGKTSIEKTTDVVSPEGATEEYGVVLKPEDLGGESAPDPAEIVVWADFSCPACKQFEELAGPTLENLVESGAATVEYRMVGFLDEGPVVNNHSKRAASAAYCVREEEGMAGWKAYFDELYASQPIEGQPGPTNGGFIDLAQDLDLEVDETCVRSEKYVPYVAAATDFFDAEGIGGTPSVFVEGQLVESNPQAIVAAVEAK